MEIELKMKEREKDKRREKGEYLKARTRKEMVAEGRKGTANAAYGWLKGFGGGTEGGDGGPGIEKWNQNGILAEYILTI